MRLFITLFSPYRLSLYRPIWQTVSPEVAKESLSKVLNVTVHVSVTAFIKELSTHLAPMEEDSSLQENRIQNNSKE